MTKVTQSHLVVGGDNAGGDIHKTVQILPTPESALRNIISKYQAEQLSDDSFKGFIDRLQHYINDKAGPVKGLEEKLAEANRVDYLEHATDMKLQFTKKLYKHQFSEAAQEVFAHVLGYIYVMFVNKVKPILKVNLPEGEKNERVDAELSSLVLSIYTDLSVCSLSVTMPEVQGMLYFLTGNCHIRWV